jgi:hypothetical protein
LAFLSLLDLDLGHAGSLDAPGATAVLAETDGVYAGAQHLFVTTYPGAWGRKAQPEDDFPMIRRSVVHEFGAGATTEYLASGGVDGWIPDTWALDEDDSGLRVLGLHSNIGWKNSDPSVGVLRARKSALVEVHHYTGMDPGALRFGWLPGLVSTGQGGPQHPQLTRTTGPVARGTLDARGFSDYLTAAGDGRVLTVSQGSAAGGGLRVDAFDIADLQRPRRTGTVMLDAKSRSQAEDDAGYSLWLPDRRILLLPAFQRIDGTLRPGLYAVRLGDDGALTRAGGWLEPGGKMRGDIDEILALPDGRVAYVGAKTVTVLNVADLSVRGAVPLTTAAAG